MERVSMLHWEKLYCGIVPQNILLMDAIYLYDKWMNERNIFD
jgi:hypothetical protein